jgi:hypothetical protein
MALLLGLGGCVRRRHDRLADHARHGVDHGRSLCVVQSVPDVWRWSGPVQQIQLVWHDDSSPASGRGWCDVARQFRGATLESIHDGAQAQQILERGQAGGRLVEHVMCVGSDLGPLGWNEGLTAVWQDQDELQTIVPMRLPENG